MIRNSFICALCILFILGCSSDQKKLENFIKEGKTYIEQQEYGKASIQLQNALEINPESVEAHKLFVRLYMGQKDIQKAFSALLALEKLTPEDMEPKVQAASLFMMTGKSGRSEAKTRIAQVLEKEPNNIKALSLQASMLIVEKEPVEKIADVYEKILSIEPTNSHAMVMLARINQSKGDPTQAKILLERALANNPDESEMYTELYAYYLTNREHDKAKDVLEKLAVQKPSDPDPQILIGNFYAVQQQPDMAEAAYLKAIEIAPDDPRVYMALAQFYDKNGQMEKAEATINDAIKKNPEDLPLQLAYTRFLYANKKLDEALTTVDSILAKKNDFQAAMEMKGRILLAQDNPGSASTIFTSLLEKEPDSPLYNYLMGSALMDMNRLDLALSHATKAIEKAPEFFEAKFLMASLHFKKRSFSIADKEVREALELRPQNYLANLLQAQIYNALGQPEKAEPMYRELISQNKDNPAPYFHLGNLYFGQNNMKSARGNYEKALERNPYLMDVFTSLIRTYALEQKFQEALKKCDDHLAKVEAYPLVASIIYNQKGNLFMGLEDTVQAKTAYEKAMSINPKYILPYLSLSRIYNIENQTDKAILLLEKLVEERPDQAGAFSTLGTLYETQGKMNQAEEHYVKAIEISPFHIQALNNLAFLYADQNREMNKALEYARKARELAGEVPAIMDTLGWVYYKKGLIDGAIQEFASCIEKNPENPLFHYHMGLALQGKGDKAGAKASLQKALDLDENFSEKDDAQKRLNEL